MSETKTKDILEQLKETDFCAACDGLRADGKAFLQDAVIEEIERLREQVAALQTGHCVGRDRVRVTVVLEADREIFPGFGKDPQDFARAAAVFAKDALSNYNPVVLSATWSPVKHIDQLYPDR